VIGEDPVHAAAELPQQDAARTGVAGAHLPAEGVLLPDDASAHQLVVAGHTGIPCPGGQAARPCGIQPRHRQTGMRGHEGRAPEQLRVERQQVEILTGREPG
jgi:hypothetical protein